MPSQRLLTLPPNSRLEPAPVYGPRPPLSNPPKRSVQDHLLERRPNQLALALGVELFVDAEEVGVAVDPKGEAMTLFGGERAHELFAQHVAGSETWTETEGWGRKVREWSLLPSKPDNHWLDCLAGCAVAASMVGIRVPGECTPTRQRKRYSQQDLRRR